MIGRVFKSTGSWYQVLTDRGEMMECRTRGKLRLEESKETNPVAVGDLVLLESDGDKGIITEVQQRKNHIVRQSTRKTGHSHVLAANLDQALLLVTLFQPRTSLGFVDRFLVTCEAFGIPQILVFNKKDLLDQQAIEWCNDVMSMYQKIGISTFLLSLTEDEVLNSLEQFLSGKITLIAGHSGTGKSTLLNRLVPSAQQVTAEVSGSTMKGVHTTTFAEMFAIDDHTMIIDTPGVKEWGLLDMEPGEISDYFPEMREKRLNCKFGSKCLHLEEPKCAIREAVERSEISISRFESYLSMVLGGDNRK